MSNLEIEPNKEYILGGDISISMESIDVACGNNTRFSYMLEKFESFIQEASNFDQHGAPTVILFGEKVHVFEHVNIDKIKSELSRVRFEGFTNLHLLIEKSFDLHREDKAELEKDKKFHPGTKLLVFTDGAPTSRPMVEKELIRIIGQIDSEDEFQIHFLTVGTIDRNLKEWLDGLHDKMEDKKINPRDFDIIHISKLEDISFLGVVGQNRHD